MLICDALHRERRELPRGSTSGGLREGLVVTAGGAEEDEGEGGLGAEEAVGRAHCEAEEDGRQHGGAVERPRGAAEGQRPAAAAREEPLGSLKDFQALKPEV